MRPDDSLEQAARKRGYALVCGCDEAGAGPLMGPVCAGAVILPEGCDIPGLDDSKKLTEKKREALYGVITERAIAWAVASVSAVCDGGAGQEVPPISLRPAQGLRHQAALCHAGPIRPLPGAPAVVPEKVEGASVMSRAEGTWGEAEVANYLRRRGYTLLAHGFHCRFGEIDLIARKDGVLCFVEVKTRTNLSCGLPREYVTPQKQQRLRKTAAWYLMVKDLDCPARFDVAEVYAAGPHPQKAARIEYIENAF